MVWIFKLMLQVGVVPTCLNLVPCHLLLSWHVWDFLNLALAERPPFITILGILFPSELKGWIKDLCLMYLSIYNTMRNRHSPPSSFHHNALNVLISDALPILSWKIYLEHPWVGGVSGGDTRNVEMSGCLYVWISHLHGLIAPFPIYTNPHHTHYTQFT